MTPRVHFDAEILTADRALEQAARRVVRARAAAMLEHFDALDRALVAKAFPETSPWWRAQVRRFYESGVSQFVGRVGRRGGKSSTWCRVAVLEALFGDHPIPPGDVGIVGIVSVSRDEAAARLRTIKAILDALGIRYREASETIEIIGKPILFKVFSASIRGVVGGTWIFALCDEVAYWRDADTGANPATEVLASLRPTMATQPHARLVMLSAPLGTDDAHARAFDAGDDGWQIAAHAETWTANPTITEEQTHGLERDPRAWARSFAAIPQASALACFDADAVERAFESRLTPDHVVVAKACIIDASSGKKDSWTYAIVEKIRDRDHEYIGFTHIEGVEGKFFDQDAGEKIVERVATFAKRHGCTRVFGDQRESLMLASAFSRHDLDFVEKAWTATSKPEAVARARRWLADGTLLLAHHEKMRRELLAFEERLTANGSFTFGARGSGHDDYVALILTAALADIDGGFRAHVIGLQAPRPEIVDRETRARELAAAFENRAWGGDDGSDGPARAQQAARDFFRT